MRLWLCTGVGGSIDEGKTMTTEEGNAEPAAVLDSASVRQIRTRRLLGELNQPSRGFHHPGELAQALLIGSQFSLLVLSFQGRIANPKLWLQFLLECVQPETPIMLLVSRDHVDLTSCVMRSVSADFLLEPYAWSELQERLSALLSRHGRGASKISKSQLC